MTDNIAVLQGYTQHVQADCDEFTLDLLVKPGTDFDDAFKAWDTDMQEFIHINGWLFTIEPEENPLGWREVDGVTLPPITWAE